MIQFLDKDAQKLLHEFVQTQKRIADALERIASAVVVIDDAPKVQ